MPRPAARAKPTVRVRRAGPGDLAALVALELASFEGDRMSARSWRAQLASPRAWLGVAERGGRLLGSALVLFRVDSTRARLYSIAVSPAARGGGVGLALLRAAQRAARTRGADALRLEVRTGNAAAIALYEREGYVRTGTFARYYEDGADAVRFEKSVRSPSPRAARGAPRSSSRRGTPRARGTSRRT